MYKRFIELGKNLSNEYKKLGKDFINLSQKQIFTQAIQELKALQPEDFNIKEQSSNYFLPKTISYSNIYQEPNNNDFSLGIFFLSKGSLVPMHDHPEMFVLNKVVWGEGQFKIFKLSDKDRSMQQKYPQEVFIKGNTQYLEQPPVVEAELQVEGVAKQGDLDIVQPIDHNIHTYRVKENFSFLAMQVPSYDNQNRFCNFYKFKSVNKQTNKYELQMIQPIDYDVNIILMDQKKCKFFA